MKADVAGDELGHESVDRPLTGRDGVKDVAAICVAFEGPLYGFHLSANPPDAVEHLFFVPNDVRHTRNIAYPGMVYHRGQPTGGTGFEPVGMNAARTSYRGLKMETYRCCQRPRRNIMRSTEGGKEVI